MGVRHEQNFGIEQGIRRSHGLDVDLMKLPHAALLRPFIPKHVPQWVYEDPKGAQPFTKGTIRMIALGDYNLRDYEEAYKLINSVYTNVWTSVYPSKISSDGVDMSGESRIDHIFLSHNLKPVNPVYLKTPASETDHAVHWTEISW